MRVWAELVERHQDVRRQPRAWTGEVRKRLMRLADRGHCDPAVRGRFTNSRIGELEEWRIRPASGRDPSHDEPLLEVDGMAEASLSVLAIVTSDQTMRLFDVRATGRRSDGTTWVIAVHLSDAGAEFGRHGLGACGHAVLHCHVGPDLDAVPRVRVPLPPLGPAEILDWVLSQVIPSPDFEPAPWSEVGGLAKGASR